MADKYNKVEPKVSTGILVSIAAVVVVVLILVFVAIPSNAEKIYNAYEETADEYFTEDHPFYGINGNQLDRYIDNDDTFLLYISSADCVSCQEHIGTLQRYFESTGADDVFENIYYFDTAEYPNAFLDLADTISAINSTTPQFILFVDGELELTLNANLSTTDQTRNTNVRTFFEDAIAAVEEE